jgi:zona occludens toxin
MSIIAYTGLPGSGKSYNAVANVIIPGLEKGRRVVTNIPLNAELIEEKGYRGQLVQFDSADYQEKGFIETYVAPNHGALYVLDEVWRLWPSGLQQSKMPKDQQQWLAEHRHHTGEDGFTDEIILVTQGLGQIAAPVRQLVESQYRHTKLTSAGSKKAFTVKVYQGGDVNPRDSDMVNQLHGKYSPKVFQWYKSHTQAKGDEALEAAADKRANVFRSPKFLAAAAFAVFGTLGGIYMAGASISGLADEEVQTVKSVASERAVTSVERSEARVTARSVAQVPPKPTGPVLSQTWRIGGWIRNEDRTLVLLASNDGRTRRVDEGCDLSGLEPECVIGGERITEYSGARKRQRGFLADAAQDWQGHVQGAR